MAGFRNRSFALAIGALAVVAAGARGQGSIQLKTFRMEAPQLAGDDLSKMLDLRTGKLRTTGPSLKANQDLFRKVSRNIIFKATYEQYYEVPETGELKPRPNDSNFDSLLSDFSQLILTPTPGMVPPYTIDQAEYIKELGKALDATFREVWAKNPPTVIRVNTGRMFALATKSGAPEFSKTIVELVTNQFFKAKDSKSAETPPELLLYALKAAEGLLGASDPYLVNRPDPNKHTVPEEGLVVLVKALEDVIEKGPQVADKAAVLNPELPGKPPAIEDDTAPKPKDPKGPKTPAPGANKLESTGQSPEQIALVRYFRRQAIRALAKVRYDSIGGENAIPRVRPAFVLAKIAVADTSISPLPSATEIAEAVIGLCGVNPTRDLKVEELATSIAKGIELLVRFNSEDRARARDNLNNTAENKVLLAVPWKLYTARLEAAFAGMKRGTATVPRLKASSPMILALVDAVSVDVLAPLGKDDGGGLAQPSLDRLSRWLEQYNKDGARSLYEDDPKYKLKPAQFTN